MQNENIAKREKKKRKKKLSCFLIKKMNKIKNTASQGAWIFIYHFSSLQEKKRKTKVSLNNQNNQNNDKMNRLSYTFVYGRNGKSFFFILRKVSIDFPIKSTNVTGGLREEIH